MRMLRTQATQPLRNAHTSLHVLCLTPACRHGAAPLEGSHLIIPHSVQYRILFPEIIAPHNHWGLLVHPEMNEPFPVFTVGDFCLKDKIFPSTYRDSLLFMESDHTKLKKKDIRIPPYKEEKIEPTTPKESRHGSDGTKEGKSTSSCRAEESCKVGETCKTEESCKTSDQTSTASSPCFQTLPVTKCHPRRGQPLQPRRGQITTSLRTAIPPDTRKGPVMKRVGNLSLTRGAAVPSTNGGGHHLWALTLWGISPRNPTLKHLPTLPMRAPAPAPGAPLSV